MKPRAAAARMRAGRLVLLFLTLLALAPLADATYTTVFAKTYTYSGVYTNRVDDDSYFVADPGGVAPVACYYRTLHGGPLGSITIRVVDGQGNVVFVDEIAGAGIVGPTLPPVGLGGFVRGTWHTIVTANGDILGTSIDVRIAAASSLSLC